jgi:nucleotide sugar dehydrogenase
MAMTKIEKEILIIGAGFVGLTLAGKLLKNERVSVTLLDSNLNTIQRLNMNDSIVFEPGLDERLQNGRSQGRLFFSDSIEDRQFDSFFVCVGTQPTGPILDGMNNLLETSLKYHLNLKKNGYLFIRSTVRVGITRYISELLAQNRRSDISVFFAPERTAEGVALKELDELPQILAGIETSKITEGSKFLEFLGFSVVHASNTEVAEFTKLVLNAWRDAVFSLSNELAMLSEYLNISFNEVLNLSNFNYPRSKISTQGPVGGPCLTKDTYILFETFPKEFLNNSVIYRARKVNELLEYKAIEIIRTRSINYKAPCTVLFLGLAFKSKPKTNDIRKSFSETIIRNLQSDPDTYNITVWDPFLKDTDLYDLSNLRISSLDKVSPDIVVIGNCGDSVKNTVVFDFINSLDKKVLLIDFWNLSGEFKMDHKNSVVFGELPKLVK